MTPDRSVQKAGMSACSGRAVTWNASRRPGSALSDNQSQTRSRCSVHFWQISLSISFESNSEIEQVQPRSGWPLVKSFSSLKNVPRVKIAESIHPSLSELRNYGIAIRAATATAKQTTTNVAVRDLFLSDVASRLAILIEPLPLHQVARMRLDHQPHFASGRELQRIARCQREVDFHLQAAKHARTHDHVALL
jgi:hypothetical protein